jgi:hypothetical protein
MEALEADRAMWAKVNADLMTTIGAQRKEIDQLKSRAERVTANTRLISAVGQMVQMVTDSLRD